MNFRDYRTSQMDTNLKKWNALMQCRKKITGKTWVNYFFSSHMMFMLIQACFFLVTLYFLNKESGAYQFFL